METKVKISPVFPTTVPTGYRLEMEISPHQAEFLMSLFGHIGGENRDIRILTSLIYTQLRELGIPCKSLREFFSDVCFPDLELKRN